jgi:hypothetical protein
MSTEPRFHRAPCAFRLRLIPAHLQGRFHALYRLLLLAQLLGLEVMGSVAGLLGLRGALLLAAILIGGIAVATLVDPALAARCALRTTPADIRT